LHLKKYVMKSRAFLLNRNRMIDVLIPQLLYVRSKMTEEDWIDIWMVSLRR
jgi:hypothetical protein